MFNLHPSRQCAFHRAINEPCALHLSPPKGGSKREFLHLALPVMSSSQVIVDFSILVCGLKIASPSLQMTNCRWNGRGHVTSRDPFQVFSLPKISLERLKLETSNLVHMLMMLIIASPSLRTTVSLKGAWSLPRDLFPFWRISDNFYLFIYLLLRQKRYNIAS